LADGFPIVLEVFDRLHPQLGLQMQPLHPSRCWRWWRWLCCAA
jgi:hypothetical protein